MRIHPYSSGADVPQGPRMEPMVIAWQAPRLSGREGSLRRQARAWAKASASLSKVFTRRRPGLRRGRLRRGVGVSPPRSPRLRVINSWMSHTTGTLAKIEAKAIAKTGLRDISISNLLLRQWRVG